MLPVLGTQPGWVFTPIETAVNLVTKMFGSPEAEQKPMKYADFYREALGLAVTPDMPKELALEIDALAAANAAVLGKGREQPATVMPAEDIQLIEGLEDDNIPDR